MLLQESILFLMSFVLVKYCMHSHRSCKMHTRVPIQKFLDGFFRSFEYLQSFKNQHCTFIKLMFDTIYNYVYSITQCVFTSHTVIFM